MLSIYRGLTAADIDLLISLALKVPEIMPDEFLDDDDAFEAHELRIEAAFKELLIENNVEFAE